MFFFVFPGQGLWEKIIFLQSIYNHSQELDFFFLKWPHLFIFVAYFANYKHLNVESFTNQNIKFKKSQNGNGYTYLLRQIIACILKKKWANVNRTH